MKPEHLLLIKDYVVRMWQFFLDKWTVFTCKIFVLVMTVIEKTLGASKTWDTFNTLLDNIWRVSTWSKRIVRLKYKCFKEYLAMVSISTSEKSSWQWTHLSWSNLEGCFLESFLNFFFCFFFEDGDGNLSLLHELFPKSLSLLRSSRFSDLCRCLEICFFKLHTYTYYWSLGMTSKNIRRW